MNSNNQNQKKVQRTTIQLSTVHWIPGTNRYRYNFTSAIDLRGKKATLAMYQYGIFNCTYNISSKLNNNTYSVKWSNGRIYDFTIQDGYYSFFELNQVFQQNFTKQKLHLVSTTNSNQVYYFASVASNATAYASQIDVSFIPKSMPTGYKLPDFSGNLVQQWSLPTTPTYPQLILSPGLQTLFGFTSQNTFPLSQTTPTNPVNVTFISDGYPVISPIFCYILTCNMVESKLSLVPNIFFQVPLTAKFGDMISSTTPSLTGLSVIPTIFNYIEISILDQNYNSLVLKDPELTISLILEIEENE